MLLEVKQAQIWQKKSLQFSAQINNKHDFQFFWRETLIDVTMGIRYKGKLGVSFCLQTWYDQLKLFSAKKFVSHRIRVGASLGSGSKEN